MGSIRPEGWGTRRFSVSRKILPADRPAPEPLTYAQLRGYLDVFVADMDAARALLLAASDAGAFAVEIDVMEIRVDINGDGIGGRRGNRWAHFWRSRQG